MGQPDRVQVAEHRDRANYDLSLFCPKMVPFSGFSPLWHQLYLNISQSFTMLAYDLTHHIPFLFHISDQR